MSDEQTKRIALEALPRTIELVRNEGRIPKAPEDSPVVVMVDQTKLPAELTFITTDNWRVVMHAIEDLVVRGAPALGVAGAAAVCLRAEEFITATDADMQGNADDMWHTFVLDDLAFDRDLYWTALSFSGEMVANARPTAVNLSWGVNRALDVAKQALDEGKNPQGIVDALYDFVKELEAQDEAANRAIGRFGAGLLPENARVLTHCNAGSLATVFYGTALGVIYAAADTENGGKGVSRVYSDETRPVGQGARLTVWELSRAHVPVTLICDNMAATVLSQGKVDAVVVGADRITACGDVANKIGTMGVAILAHHFGVPFYVAAPTSTIDFSMESGAEIPIEERAAEEVLPNAIEGVEVFNPAFDVTPAELVTAIITEKGVFAPSDLVQLDVQRDSDQAGE